MLGLPLRIDFRGIAQEDLAPGTRLTIQAVPGKQNPTDLRAQTLTLGKTTTEMR